MATILAIETSCDETAVAIVRDRLILSNIVASQIKIHQQYGGVVPEVASRQHLETINFCIEAAFRESGLDWSAIAAIAATCAPGLLGALLVGVTAGKTLAMVRNLPFLGVHHLEGHIYAAYLNEPELEPPFLCLLVSGGHTSLIRVRDSGQYEQLGATRDDAAGEAFDKVARLLGLGYPGGPAIDKIAIQGNPHAFVLPEGRVSKPEGGYYPYDFSFSGLKTAMLRLVQKLEVQGGELPIADLAASFQETVARSLVKKTIACALDYELKAIVLGGGVAANSALRKHLQEAATQHNLQVYCPPLSLCTDNAAAIACAAADHFNRGEISPLTLGTRSRMAVTEVAELYL
ncbi:MULTISPECIES: tRNA (adenosine(37)-N6)-threonylcarbamoyltransferase complex transferase subunit TsaD [Spirulina sp. CCY15215]|uniref:tRNA (adenosine(37)-N6)-threonylcarbamoyltransferase complex transferase subunit TsaD n=1 Tax=Spirulina sp. CCY15215 TaxID=2767591 RepID=UPI00194FC3C5|nr:tRNA (adenosine(37)-N6)-threonylcarbamoyltransferase complex transferase subunit TsaD [Spirulina major]